MINASAVRQFGRVVRALRRSRLRAQVFEFLCEVYPEWAYPGLIADAVGASYENVVGALRGLGKRYRPEDSLLVLGIVEERREGKLRFYRLRDEYVELCRALGRGPR
ncbi:Uncharacterized protein conserved in archaea [Pyrobaculum oguniense TE7]|uniref:Uncharacterized protein conserved in archaea n=1 Tax=Pyrobaculum oguniense (strain DSM 13380 / JCM 10595 / TE7) TaxID=698757 RepID=H6QBA5_PYROT|nr:Uncharacterized protein conserved in archaea [Pyrobaculum oguniense TE7]